MTSAPGAVQTSGLRRPAVAAALCTSHPLFRLSASPAGVGPTVRRALALRSPGPRLSTPALVSTPHKTLGPQQRVELRDTLVHFCLLFLYLEYSRFVCIAKTRLGADCDSDHQLLIAKFRLKLKKVGKATRPSGVTKIKSLTIIQWR